MNLRERVRVRSRLRSVRARWINRHNALPDFLILGTQKGGTTSLFAYLASLPGVIAPDTKELQYFSEMIRPNSYKVLGPGWYRSNFPLERELRAAGAITGEASPRYMSEQLAMTRITRDLPDSRWIIVLRDPIERALSQYAMFLSSGHEQRSASEALDHNLRLITGEVDADEPLSSLTRIRHDYAQRGHYVEQLTFIAGLRPERPTLVLFSENLFASDAASISLLHSFLGLEEPGGHEFTWLNKGLERTTLEPAIHTRLSEHLSEANAGLAELLRSDRFVTIDPAGWPAWVDGERSGS